MEENIQNSESRRGKTRFKAFWATFYIALIVLVMGFASFLAFSETKTSETIRNVIPFVTPLDLQKAEWVVEGDYVYIDNSWVYIKAPSHIYGSGDVIVNLTNKKYGREIDLLFGFNSENAMPKKEAYLYKPKTFNETHSFSCNFENNFINFTTDPNHFWCFYNHTTYTDPTNTTINESNLILVYEHDWEWKHNPTKTAYWNISKTTYWKEVTNRFEKINYNYQGFDKWYAAENQTMNIGQEYSLKFHMNVKPNTDGKYWICLKPTSQTIDQAIDNDNFLCLDPWWNATYDYKRQVTNNYYGASNLYDFPIVISGDTGFDIGGGKNFVWTLSNLNDSTYLYYDNYSYYISVNGSETTDIPYEVAWGNETSSSDSGTIWTRNDAVLVLHGDVGTTESALGIIVINNSGSVDRSSTSKIGYSMDFEGEGPPPDQLVVQNESISSLGTTDILSFSVWVYYEETAGDTGGQYVFRHSSGNSMFFTDPASNTFYFHWGTGSVNEATPLNEWTHWAGTQNTTTVRLFKNGVMTDESTGSYSIGASNEMYLGTDNTGNRNLDAKVDELMIFNRTLTKDEVRAFYDQATNMSTLGAEELPYSDDPPFITLNTPLNNTNHTTSSIDFNCTGQDDFKVDNVTLFINEVIYNTAQDSDNYTEQFQTVPLSDGNYNWSCTVCDNATTSQCNDSYLQFFIKDSNPPYYTNLATQTIENNESIGYNINATDDGGHFEYWDINWTDTITINQSGFLNNTIPLSVGNQRINLSVNDTFGNINSTILTVTVANLLDNPLVYDEHDDSSLDATLWQQSGSGGNFTVSENTKYLESYSIYNTAGSDGLHFRNLTSKQMPEISTIDKVVIHSYLQSKYADAGGIKFSKAQLIVFNNMIKNVERNNTDTGTIDDQSLWQIIRNSSVGGNIFEVYDDNVWVEQINASTDNPNITLTTIFHDDTATEIISKGRLYYEHYETGSGSVAVTLNSPDNNVDLLFAEQEVFNVSMSTTTGGLVNASLFIDDALNETLTISGSSNESIFTKSFLIGDYNWSVEACNNLSSCRTSTTRFFEVAYLIVNNESYNSSTYETATEDFSININYNSSNFASVTSELYYNGSSTSANAIGGSGDNRIHQATIDIPLLSGAVDENKSFHWIFYLTNDSGTTQSNTSETNQTVQPIDLGACSGATNITSKNYTVYDEIELSRLTEWTFGGTFQYFIGSGTTKKNSSISLDPTNESLICINQNTTYLVDATIGISKDGYTDRLFFFDDESFDDSLSHTQLYLLNSSEGSNIIIQVVDQGITPLEGYFVEIEKYHPESNNYTLIIREKTDEFGQFVARLVENTVKYRFSIYNSTNDLVKETSDITVACRTTICVLQFVVEDTTDDFERFENITDFQSVLSFNNNTNISTVTWTDTTGDSIQYFRLFVERVLLNGTTTVCNSTSTSLSNSLNCNVGSSTANYRIQFFRKITNENERRISVLNIKVGQTFKSFGLEGLFWSFILLFTLIAIGSYNPIVGIVCYLVGFIGLGLIGVISFSIPIIIANLVIGIVFIWAFRS